VVNLLLNTLAFLSFQIPQQISAMAILALRISGWSPIKGMPILEHRREFGPQREHKVRA
jgi:hypothetical protein